MAVVSVGTLRGKVCIGRLERFSPTLPQLILEQIIRTADGQRHRRRLRIDADAVAFVAFHRETTPQLNQPRIKGRIELRVHVAGGNAFTVAASQGEINSLLGFYAHPVAADSPFQEFYFYAGGVNAKESTELIGKMLVGSKTAERLLAVLPDDRKDAPKERAPINKILLKHDSAAQKQRQRSLAEVDVDQVMQGLVAAKDIERALKEQKQRPGAKLGDVLVEMELITERDLYRTLALKFYLPFVDLDTVEINPDAASEVHPKIIRQYQILPIDSDQTTLTVAISDPLNTACHDLLRFQLKKLVREVLVQPTQLKAYVDSHLGGLSEAEEEEGTSDDISLIIEALENEHGFAEAELDEAKAEARDPDSPVVRLVNQVIVDGYRRGASDIHVEPNGPRQPVRIRFRIDGACMVHKELPPGVRLPLATRLKIMARLDISERRKPQDGKIRFRWGKKLIELRMSTMPTVNQNEDIVLRILASSKPMQLEEMGMSQRNLSSLQAIVVKPYGLILCVGPTGSGKTTTLHSAIGYINQVDRKIWTAEDPVEITQAGLRQVQVQPKIGFTFAAAMRGFLRLDPDVIMIGEMRDHETASIAVEASLTGHLVFSTLHTNSAPETVTRLLDMGLDSFTFADALRGILAQRLARRLCQACREQYEPDETEFQQLVAYYGAEALQKYHGVTTRTGFSLWRARDGGCKACDGNGLKGRVALHELLINDDEIQAAVQQKVTAAVLEDVAKKAGMTTLVQDGIDKCIAGQVGLKQVLAVCSA